MIRKALVVCLDNLGDLVFSSSLVGALKTRFPGVSVGLWCKSYAADVAPLIPRLDRTFASDPFWDSSPGRAKGALFPFIKTVARIRAEHYEVALVASQASLAAASVFAAGIPMRVGLSRGGNWRWLTRALAPEDRGRGVLLELGRLLEPLGGGAAALKCVLDPAPLEGRRRELASFLGQKPTAALHPFAGSADRCVDLSVWISLGEALTSRGLGLIWIGTAEELSGLRRLAGERPGWSYVDRMGGGALIDTAAAISSARIFVGHDSGPLHLASALGVPCLGIYAPGEPRRTFPQGRAPWRIISRPSPEGVTIGEILGELDLIGDRWA